MMTDIDGSGDEAAVHGSVSNRLSRVLSRIMAEDFDEYYSSNKDIKDMGLLLPTLPSHAQEEEEVYQMFVPQTTTTNIPHIFQVGKLEQDSYRLLPALDSASCRAMANKGMPSSKSIGGKQGCNAVPSELIQHPADVVTTATTCSRGSRHHLKAPVIPVLVVGSGASQQFSQQQADEHQPEAAGIAGRGCTFSAFKNQSSGEGGPHRFLSSSRRKNHRQAGRPPAHLRDGRGLRSGKRTAGVFFITMLLRHAVNDKFGNGLTR
jgi:hypothetical protein